VSEDQNDDNNGRRALAESQSFCKRIFIVSARGHGAGKYLTELATSSTSPLSRSYKEPSKYSPNKPDTMAENRSVSSSALQIRTPIVGLLLRASRWHADARRVGSPQGGLTRA
jgi:hypothetical protein